METLSSSKLTVKLTVSIVRLLAIALVSLGVMGSLYAHSTTVSDHRAKQNWPIELGTSGGNIFDRSSTHCCSGTLGALVTDGSFVYILSNNHVLARSNKASLGDLINHPGQIDQSCRQSGDLAVLHQFVPMKFDGSNNEVDAAIAAVYDGAVRSDGAILGIGPVSANTVAAFPGQLVQKSGRTTGHTTSTVTAVDVTANVGYSDQCGGGSTKTARFVGQISISNSNTFGAGGDSGSLIVEYGSVDSNDGLPRAVGLLFAGGSTRILANPIDRVLDLMNVSMLGGGGNSDEGSGDDGGNGDDGDGADDGGNDGGDDDGGDDDGDPNPVARVETISYSGSGGRNSDQHLNISLIVVDSLGNSLAGAVVEVSINDRPYSGTTGNDGAVGFRWNNAPNGVYTTTVSRINDQVDPVYPENSFHKGVDPMPAIFSGDAMAAPSFLGNSLQAKGNSAAGLEIARNANRQNSPWIMRFPGVAGHGVELDANGQPYIAIYLENENAGKGIPAHLDAVPVRPIVTGPFMAY